MNPCTSLNAKCPLHVYFGTFCVDMLVIIHVDTFSLRQCPADVKQPHSQRYQVYIERQFLAFRLLLDKVGPLFEKKGLIFKVEYITGVRDWMGAIPKIVTMYDAYRRSTVKDAKVVPHSFTFIRRDCILPTTWQFDFFRPILCNMMMCAFSLRSKTIS